MQTVSFSYRLGHSTVCISLRKPVKLYGKLFILYPDFIRPPKTSEEWKQLSVGFERLWNFPHCLRAIDGKHIQMQAPANCESQYYSYKSMHSIVLMAVCDYNYCFTLLDIGDKVMVEFSATQFEAEQ